MLTIEIPGVGIREVISVSGRNQLKGDNRWKQMLYAIQLQLQLQALRTD